MSDSLASVLATPSVDQPAPALAGCPRHVAIIMDGNHRWARTRHLPGAAGHRAGARNVRRIAEACADAGVQCLTLFAFSTENWHRPRPEVSLLMDLMRSVLNNDLEELHGRGVRLRVIGDQSRFAADLQQQMDYAEELTRANQRMMLNIAANYGGRWDIVQAARQLAAAHAAGELSLEDIDEQALGQRMALAELPPPDLCIRTGGDHRISNFLLWDFAYTEFYFTQAFWPAFDDEALSRALTSFVERQRRFGRRC